MSSLDYLLVGGGLQNALVTSALAHHRPGARVALVEAEKRLGGSHVWCFHSLDIPEPAVPFVEPCVTRRWAKYRVCFPSYVRVLDEPYAAVTSDSVHERLSLLAAAGCVELLLGTSARHVEAGRVVLESGVELRARVVLDARGPDRFMRREAIGYQKFVGLELDVVPESAPLVPTLMDCSVDQLDGLRFVYTLPLSPGRTLVEDTYFSDHPELDQRSLEARVLAYASESGLVVRGVVRRERGVLPLPGRAPIIVESQGGLVHAGYQGGWFHPATGYSFPLAARVAHVVATTSDAELPHGLRRLAARVAHQQRFAALLNRMLFRGFAPERRHAAFERFYRLPSETVRRFYSLSLTRADRARIVCGRPPPGFSARRFFSAIAPGDRVDVPQPGRDQ